MDYPKDYESGDLIINLKDRNYYKLENCHFIESPPMEKKRASIEKKKVSASKLFMNLFKRT